LTNLLAITTPMPCIQLFIEGAAKEALVTIVEYEFREMQLNEELDAAITEYEFQLRMLRIKTWWKVGGIIRDWHTAYEKESGGFVPLEGFCNAVGEKLGRGKRSSYNAVQIRKHFPTVESLNELPFGKALSLRLIVNKIIPGLNAGKTLAEIADDDRRDMAKREAN